MATTGNPTIHWPQNSTQVEVNDPSESEFWCWRFRVSAGKLKQAVRAVGSNFKDVVEHLNSKR
jgi:hypothetical protein